MKSISITIKGRVQGVGFRYFVYRVANQLNLVGFVRNCSNGDVYIEVEATEDSLNLLIDQLRVGSPRSQVTNLIISEIPIKNFTSFYIDK